MTHIIAFVALIVTAYIGLIIVGAIVHLRARRFNWSAIGICSVYAGVFGLLATGAAWLIVIFAEWIIASILEWLSR
jgi:hypothetical protein